MLQEVMEMLNPLHLMRYNHRIAVQKSFEAAGVGVAFCLSEKMKAAAILQVKTMFRDVTLIVPVKTLHI